MHPEFQPRDARSDAYILPRVPDGWYGVLRSGELPPGKVVSLHCFGMDMVAFRDPDGRPTVLDAFCPHYGAHLGGGRLVDGAVECPFHGWRFGPDGRCTSAPHAAVVPRTGVACHAIREHSGLIFVAAGARKPTWEVPEIPEATSSEFGPPVLRRYSARTHIQEMRENIVDESHFQFIHGLREPMKITFEEDGPFATAKGTFPKPVLGIPMGGDVTARMYGPGVMVVRFESRLMTIVAVALSTPIDDQVSELRMIYYIRKPPYVPFLHPLFRAVFTFTSDDEVATECEIWERKAFTQRPLFLPHETGIRALRRWYDQFYEGG